MRRSMSININPKNMKGRDTIDQLIDYSQGFILIGGAKRMLFFDFDKLVLESNTV